MSTENDPMDVEVTTSSKQKSKGQLPEHLEHMRTRVTIGKAAPTNTQTYSYSGAFTSSGFDNSFDLEDFKKNFKINILKLDRNEKENRDDLVFEMIGVDAAIANTFRRIMLSEVSTMAIEKVIISNNTSIIPDEVLAHRLGLIPIKVDPRLFTEKPEVYEHDQEKLEDDTHIVLKLDVVCKRRKGVSDDAPAHLKYENSDVLSSDLKWVPIGAQAERFKDDPIRPVHHDIPIAKLRPGQAISLECICEKNIGKEHAKWSPVATASYRLLPEITFIEPVRDALADELKQKCPMNVFDIEDLGNGHRQAVVARPRDCTMCRECIRENDWDKRVKLTRVKDHFIFSVESTGVLKSEEIVKEAFKVFMKKCQNITDHIAKLAEGPKE